MKSPNGFLRRDRVQTGSGKLPLLLEDRNHPFSVCLFESCFRSGLKHQAALYTRCYFLVAVVAHRTLSLPKPTSAHSTLSPSSRSDDVSLRVLAHPSARLYVCVTPMKVKSISRKNKTTHRRRTRSATWRVRQHSWVGNRVLGHIKK